MKWIRSALLCWLLALCCLLPAGSFAEAAPPALTSPAEAEAFVRTLLSDDAARLDTAYLMTEQLRMAIALSGGFRAVHDSLSALGAAGHIGPAYATVFGGFQAYRVPCAFAQQPIDLVLTMDGDAIAGLVTAGYTGGTDETALELETLELPLPVPGLGELPGTLTLPDGEGPFVAVVLVHGSGPNDRDETLSAQKPFRDLAEGLAALGIASYRYDKRTYVYGRALAEDRDLTLMDETVDDAAAAVQLLAAREEIDRIFVLGHSLGAMAIPAIDRALRDQPVGAQGYVLLAAPARPIQELMREQYRYLATLTPEGTLPGMEEALAALDRLDDPDSLPEDEPVAGAYAPYWRWLRDYDPLTLAREIAVPCLLLQGEEDYQVTMTDYALWEEAVGGLPDWTLISFPGLTHTFTPGLKAEGPAAYARNEKLSPEVLREIADFILSVQ